MTKLNIPFKRPLFPPSFKGENTVRGDDILAVKRMVSRAGFWPWGQFDDVYWERFSQGDKNRLGRPIKGREGVKGLQRKLRIKPVSGYYGKGTHNGSLLLKVPEGKPHSGEFVWDQTAINLYKGYEDLSPAESIVKDIFYWWNYLVNREPSIHYSQARPITILRQNKRPPIIPNYLDCSGTFIACAWLAGAMAPDPWYQYNGAGYTGSLVNGGIKISEAEIDKYCKTHYVGLFYGSSIWNTTHIVAAESSNKIYSHGKEAGPEIIRNNLHYHTRPLIAIRAYPVI